MQTCGFPKGEGAFLYLCVYLLLLQYNRDKTDQVLCHLQHCITSVITHLFQKLVRSLDVAKPGFHSDRILFVCLMLQILCTELQDFGLLESRLLGIIFGNSALQQKSLIVLAALCHITTGSHRHPAVSSEWVAFFMVINLLGPAVRHLTSQLTTGSRIWATGRKKTQIFPNTQLMKNLA